MDVSQVLTWSQLVRVEPRLGQLHLDCRFADHGDPMGFDGGVAWEGSPEAHGLKQGLVSLVGEKADREDPMIRSRQAYDLASEECRRALPPSRPGTGLPEQNI